MKAIARRGRSRAVAGCLAALAAAFAVTAGAGVEPFAGDVVFLPLPGQSAVPGPQFEPKFRYLFGSPARWTQPLRWRYNHAGAPPAIAADKALVLREITSALDKWKAACGVEAIYDGETTIAPDRRLVDPAQGAQPDRQNVVGWAAVPAGSAGITYAWYESQANGARAFIDADVLLSPAFVTSASQVARTAVHEWGHALGLAHAEADGALMSGPPESAYNALLEPSADDIRGCRCLYGPAPFAPAGYGCSMPGIVDFGSVALGDSATRDVAFTNHGNAPLVVGVLSGTGAEFSVAGCAAGTTLLPGANCTLTLGARPAALGARSAAIEILASDGPYRLPVTVNGVADATAGTPVGVVEFYRADVDHYFISSLAPDIAALDSGTLRGWVRTGRSFKAHATPVAGTSPVCRFYLPPPYGDSHFYGRDARECSATAAANPGFVLESPAVMHLALPVAGVCPADTVPVYRVFSARADANHRYTTDRALRDQMVARGWLPEGDGADRVVMCAVP